MLRNGLQPVVRQVGIEAAREAAGTMEAVGGISEVERLVRRLEATLVEDTVVRDERQPLDAAGDEGPCGAEIGCVGGVALRQAVHLRRTVGVIVRIGADELINRVDNLPALDQHDADAANAAPLAVGGLKIDGCKRFF